uniref:hypothetical protein n=1 Tax=Streptacidiphilus rugosus TaxID=405783 RepID=UPI00068A944A
MTSATLTRRLSDATFTGWTTVTGQTLGAYQAAIVRIGFALTFGGFLLREWPHRRVLYGDLAPWSQDLARQMLGSNHAFTVLIWSDDRWWFECVYAAAIVVSGLLLVGWRTRTTSLLFMVLVLSIQNRSILVGDGGDNVVHLMAIYLAFTRCGQVWSLDARAARRGAREGATRSASGSGWGSARYWRTARSPASRSSGCSTSGSTTGARSSGCSGCSPACAATWPGVVPAARASSCSTRSASCCTTPRCW